MDRSGDCSGIQVLSQLLGFLDVGITRDDGRAAGDFCFDARCCDQIASDEDGYLLADVPFREFLEDFSAFVVERDLYHGNICLRIEDCRGGAEVLAIESGIFPTCGFQ